ncbi:MAG: 30S ribosomal protein S21 [Candidatus Margulisbacteria bacterium]|nr:30S ribosomal protein S21 [Candidatus Margulisiibacteriota bacterium]
MAEVKKNPHDSLDKLLRKFKRKLKEEGNIEHYRSKEHYEKPSEARKRREAEARRRGMARQRDEW